MDGTEGERAERCRLFARELENACGIKTVMYDERRTTILAAGFMDETGTRGKKRKDVIDTLSSQIILQSYLDRNR
jgi:putative Holliday junction resolvase